MKPFVSWKRKIFRKWANLVEASASVAKRDSSQPSASLDGLGTIAWRARHALGLNDFGEALRQSQLLIDRWPNRPEGFLIRAQTLEASGESPAAFQSMLDCLPLHMDHPKSLSVMRTLASDQGEFKQADSFANRLLEIAPTNQKNLAFLCDRKIELEDFTTAYEHAVALATHYPDWAGAWRRLARVDLARGRPDAALARVNEAALLHPKDPKLLKLGWIAAREIDDFVSAKRLALAIAELTPGDLENRNWLVVTYMRARDFSSALTQADAIVRWAPDAPDGAVIKARCLAALNRVDEALETIRVALLANPGDQGLLATGSSMAFQNGHFRETIELGLEAVSQSGADRKSLDAVALAYMASGNVRGAEEFVHSVKDRPAARKLKAPFYLAEMDRLKKTCPTIVAAWAAALQPTARPAVLPRDEACEPAGEGAIMIQYWSQGTPPPEVRLVLLQWQELFEHERLGEVRLFDRATAAAWIAQNAPEFSHLFSQTFHYAMEADLFRIAFASKLPCIYADMDAWPLKGTPDLLRFGLRSGKSMLYFRSFRPWIVNGFFISRPDCPFFTELARQSLSVKLEGLNKNHETIEFAFGPTRYNRVLTDLLSSAAIASVSRCEDIGGCSEVAIDAGRVLFTHEAAVASVKPPFQLDYKQTSDNWKHVSVTD